MTDRIFDHPYAIAAIGFGVLGLGWFMLWLQRRREVRRLHEMYAIEASAMAHDDRPRFR